MRVLHENSISREIQDEEGVVRNNHRTITNRIRTRRKNNRLNQEIAT